jgi:hypothetical protein
MVCHGILEGSCVTPYIPPWTILEYGLLYVGLAELIKVGAVRMKAHGRVARQGSQEMKNRKFPLLSLSRFISSSLHLQVRLLSTSHQYRSHVWTIVDGSKM